MASTDVGKLRVVLAAETDRFNKQLEKSRKANTKLSKSMRGTAKSANVMSGAMAKLGAVAGGALGARAVFNLAQKYISLGDEIAKTSKRLGIGIEALQALQIEAKAGGVETEQLNKALAKFGVNVGEVAALGTGEFKNALDRLKISLVDTGGTAKSIEALLVEFAQKMGNVADQNERLALAADAFGTRAGPRILELLPLWAEGLDAVKKSASELATITGADQIRALEAQQDALDRLGKAWDSFWLSAFGGFAIDAGFGELEAQTRREIQALESLHPWLLTLTGSTDLLAAARERLAAAQWKEAAAGGAGIFAGTPAESVNGTTAPVPPALAAFLGGMGGPQETTAPESPLAESPLAAMETLQEEILVTETAYTRFADSALKENELIDASLSTVASGLSNTIASALATGKLDFASFAQSAAASLAQIITQQLIIREPGGVWTGGRRRRRYPWRRRGICQRRDRFQADPICHGRRGRRSDGRSGSRGDYASETGQIRPPGRERERRRQRWGGDRGQRGQQFRKQPEQ